MKILAVTHNSEFSGGANRSLFMVLCRLREEYGADVRVLVPSKKGMLVDKLEEAGIPWDHIPYYGVMTGLNGNWKDFLRKLKVTFGYILETAEGRYLAAGYRKEHFDLVYTNTRLPVIGAVIARALNIPHVCHVREFGALQPYWPRWDYRAIYENSSRVILISHALSREFQKYVPGDNLVTVHNGIESPLNLMRTAFGKHEGFHLLLTGRLVADKGHMDAIRALKLLRDRGYGDIWLHFAGSAPNAVFQSDYEKMLHSAIQQDALQDRIVFHGEVMDMPALRLQCDAELMCAICETFGRVTVEGMRSGLLVIGTDTGGTPEIVTDGETGLLYRQGDAESLAQKIAFAYDSREEAGGLAEKGYDFAQTHFTPEANVRNIYEVLQSVVSQ